TLKLKTNIGKYKFVQSNNNDILITNDEIILNNIELSAVTTPQESPENWFTWDNSGTQITGLSDIGLNQKRIVLPSKATSIANNTFYNNKTLVSVDMSLTKITSIFNGVSNGVGTFRGSYNIISITLPPSLTLIGYGAFYSCRSLTSINIPDSVTSIGDYAFRDCSSLTSINIPDGVTSIGAYTFYNCSSLTSITIPDSVTLIRSYTFNGCSSLTSITMPNSVTSIGTRVFTNVPSTCVMNVSSTWDRTLATNAGYEGIFVVD
ncbi:MAG: leucine-rich repeat domain-containing protein, partial [Ureaplasma sp.]|nr:leucine-rich repeat domain-containing protein [Ureaplasma sp.]